MTISSLYQPASFNYQSSQALRERYISILLNTVFLFWEQCLHTWCFSKYVYHEWDDTERTVSIVCDTWQVPNKWFIWHGRDIQANHLAPASNKAIRGTHQRHNRGGRDKLQGTEDQLLLEGKTQWKNWMGLVRETGIKINNIFLTSLRNLIRMNLIPKLVAVLRCQSKSWPMVEPIHS